MIQAVIFDVDGVLIDSLNANFQFYKDLLKTAGYDLPKFDKFKATYHMTMLETIPFLTGLSSKQEIKRIWKLGETGKVPYPTDKVCIPEGMPDIIKNLNKDYKLAIVTSRIRRGVFHLPQLKQLKDYFHTAVSFEDTEAHKPNPAPLLLAVKRMNVSVENTAYIGDAETDIVAAKAARMKIILYKNRYKGANGYFSSFKQLPQIISSL